MKKIYRYFIPGIIVICLISGFASAISIDSHNLPGFISTPMPKPDQINPSFSPISYVNEYSHRLDDLSGVGMPSSIYSGYTFIIFPDAPRTSSLDKSNPIGFVNVSFVPKIDYCNGSIESPPLLNPLEAQYVNWKFDINGISTPAIYQEYVYKETDTACGDCGQLVISNT
jgi:hypothetical protein